MTVRKLPDHVLCFGPGRFEVMVDGKLHGTWATKGAAQAGLVVEQRRAAARKTKMKDEQGKLKENGMTDEDAVASLKSAQAMVKENLPEIAHEIMEWQRTGLLVSGRLRQVAATLKEVSTYDTLQIVEKFARDAAFEVVAGLGRPAPPESGNVREKSR